MPQELSRPEIRKLIETVLRTDPELDAFCIDHFPAVKRRFTSGMDRVAKENLLIELAPEYEIFQKLLLFKPEQVKAYGDFASSDADERSTDSLWPILSGEAKECLDHLKIEYTKAKYPSRSWSFSPNRNDASSRVVFNELQFHSIIEPITFGSWRFTDYAIELIMSEVPVSDSIKTELQQLADEYLKAGYPNHRAWIITFHDEGRDTESELLARDLIEVVTPTGRILTERGIEVVKRLIQSKSTD